MFTFILILSLSSYRSSISPCVDWLSYLVWCLDPRLATREKCSLLTITHIINIIKDGIQRIKTYVCLFGDIIEWRVY